MYGEVELFCIKIYLKKFIIKFDLLLGFFLMLYIMFLFEV